MRIVSVNVGTPREIRWRGSPITTAIFKFPVDGPVTVRRLNLEGDAQADLAAHGGPDKAIYLYPREHYPYWEAVLGQRLPPGALGENLTSEGLLETELRIGDELAVGTALLQVAQPRIPCVKLAARHGRPDLPERFVRAGRPGVYLRVLREGELRAGDSVTLGARARELWTVSRVAALLSGADAEPGARARLAGYPLLGEGARRSLSKRAGPPCSVDLAEGEDIPRLAELLAAAGLPVAGFPDHTPVVLAARSPDGGVLGGVALEIRGSAALLRSAVVVPEARGTGVGGALVAAALATAWGAGLESVSLLTETAEAWFPRFGFRRVERGALPASLASSEELRGACPDSAAVMTLRAPSSPPGT